MRCWETPLIVREKVCVGRGQLRRKMHGINEMKKRGKNGDFKRQALRTIYII